MAQKTDIDPWVSLMMKPQVPEIQAQVDEALRDLRKAAEDFIARMATLNFPAAVVIDVDRDPRQ
jgi:hypothetical protein